MPNNTKKSKTEKPNTVLEFDFSQKAASNDPGESLFLNKIHTLDDLHIEKRDGQIIWVIEGLTPNSYEGMEHVGDRHAKRHLYAAIDWFFLRLYANPLTAEGLIVKRMFDPNKHDVGENVARIGPGKFYKGKEKIERHEYDPSDPKNFNTMWKEVSIDEGYYWTRNIREVYEEVIQKDGSTKWQPQGVIGKTVAKSNIFHRLMRKGSGIVIRTWESQENLLKAQLEVISLASAGKLIEANNLKWDLIRGRKAQNQFYQQTKASPAIRENQPTTEVDNETGEITEVKPIVHKLEVAGSGNPKTQGTMITMDEIERGTLFCFGPRGLEPRASFEPWHGMDQQVNRFEGAARLGFNNRTGEYTLSRTWVIHLQK
jgi:hypothetical protein